MIKILYFDWHSEASEFYRAMPLDYINNKQISITRSTERDIKASTINLYDVIVILRPSSDAHLSLIKLAKDMGKKIISDWDDDPLHLSETNPMYGYYEGDKHNTIKCLALADEVWVENLSIKKSFRLYNKNIHIIPNCHNDYIFKVEDKKPFKFNHKMMWRGGHSHIGDIYQPGTSEWIVKLINNNKKWNFYWLGQKFEWIEYRVKYGNFYHNAGASTVQFYKMMHEINPCAFFYPLSNNLFNQSKSVCSFLEATYSGAAYFGNKELAQFDLDCILPLNVLMQVMSKDYYSTEMGQSHKESWDFIKDNLLLSNVNKIRENRLIEIGK